jgi:cell division inhibitor SulA
MKMTPGERMEENWLRAHGLSREKLAALPPKEREVIMKQMKQDIEKKLKDQTEQKAAKVDITV